MEYGVPRLTVPVIGVLKGYDQLLNLVLDDVEEEVSGAFLVPLGTRQPRTDNTRFSIEPL